MSFKFKYKKSDGSLADGELTIQEVAQCEASGNTITNYLQGKYGDYDRDYGSVISQAWNSIGVFLHDDKEIGARASTVAEALGETRSYGANNAGSPIVSVTPKIDNDGDAIIRRALFGETILNLVESNLLGNEADRTEQAFRRMIATSYTLNTGVFIQPKINTNSAMDDEYPSSPVENTLPPQMVSIGLSSETRSIPAYTIGLEITDKARLQIPLDLVSIIIAQHTKIQRNRGIYRDISYLFAGNAAMNEPPVPSVTAGSLDPTIQTAGVLTEKAWSSFLIDPDSPYSYDVAIMDKDAYMAVVERTGRLELPAGGYASHGFSMNSDPTILNMIQVGVPDVILVKNGVLPAGTILVFDSRRAIAKVSDATVNYQAQEDSALRRNSGFRWDWSELLYRLMGVEPFKALSLTP